MNTPKTFTRPLNVGFTGTRHGLSESQCAALHDMLSHLFYQPDAVWKPWFHHGDCIGADKEAHEVAIHEGYRTYSHPPKDEKLRAFCRAEFIAKSYDYQVRNLNIVSESDVMVACPREPEEQVRSGTWSTIRKARTHFRPLILILPSGGVKLERCEGLAL